VQRYSAIVARRRARVARASSRARRVTYNRAMSNRGLRLLVLSDLHLEFAPLAMPGVAAGRFDVVVLAGDIHQSLEALRWARRTFPSQPIVQVAGNHEHFGAAYQPTMAAMQACARDLGIHLLEHAAVTIGAVRFLGCTLWTDYRLYERPGRPVSLPASAAMAIASGRMIDYGLIDWDDAAVAPGRRKFRPEDSVALHNRSRAWLATELSRPCAGARSCVVVTHHLPSWHSVSPEYSRADTNPAFASDLDDLLPAADLWIHGHTHSSHDYFVAGTRVVANPRGYPMRSGGFENPRFDPVRIVTV